MGAAGFDGSFAPIAQYEKWEIHPVFPHFSYFRLGQNTARISLPHYAVLPEFIVSQEIVQIKKKLMKWGIFVENARRRVVFRKYSSFWKLNYSKMHIM